MCMCALRKPAAGHSLGFLSSQITTLGWRAAFSIFGLVGVLIGLLAWGMLATIKPPNLQGEMPKDPVPESPTSGAAPSVFSAGRGLPLFAGVRVGQARVHKSTPRHKLQQVPPLLRRGEHRSRRR